MLWNIIRDFFVQNFFGGKLSNGTIINSCKLGDFVASGSVSDFNTAKYYMVVGNVQITLGDWLSTTFTLISFVLIFILMVLFIKWIFKVVSNTLLLR